MKLILAIVNNDDSAIASSALTEAGFFVTKLSTTGGFLMVGNTTLMIGVQEDRATDDVQDMNQTVDLYYAATDAGKRLAEKAADKQVQMEVVGEPCQIPGNPVLIDEMIMNLMDNAIKYNKPGGTMEVSVEKNGKAALLMVKDSGVGIEEAHIDRVFERFYRVDQSRSRETEGHGLGLAIVKHIVQLHGGEIRLESKVDEGTKVEVRFGRQA